MKLLLYNGGIYDFKDKTIRINKSLDFQPGEDDEIFGETKNHMSRVIDMADITVSALKTHLTLQNQNKLMLNDIYRHDLNLIFCKRWQAHAKIFPF